MKKEKIVKLSIIILGVLAIGIIALLLSIEQGEENVLLGQYEGTSEREIAENLTEVTNRNNFYIVQSCVEKFYTNYSEIFDEEYEGYIANTDEQRKEIKAERVKRVYEMLDEEYLQYTGIALENLASKLPQMQYTSILIKNMYYIEKNQRMSAYFVFGSRSGTLNSEATDFAIMVKIDYQNRTFKVTLGEQVDNYYKELKNGQKFDIKEEEIENVKYNAFSYEHITEKEYIKDLFAHYKKALRIDKKYSFDLLDKKYKEVCFENLDEYLSYLNSNYSKIASGGLDEYSQEEKEGYVEYIFKDKKGKYYIFKENAPFKYTVIIDNYIIPTGDFINQYNSSSEAEKVILNITKFFMGIDDKNYGYSYSVLSESFKKSKYPSKAEFINYVKQNFFEQNEIEYIKYKKENGLYIYEIKVKDATGSSTDEKAFNMIVKLKNGTDFEMSFGTN